jgi:two-component system sensor histidine kinase RegB
VALCIAILLRWLLGTLEDLQERVELLKRQQDRLDRLKVAGAIAAGFSHEFSSPLYSLKLRVERLVRGAEGALRDDALAARDAIAECERILATMTQTGLKADQLELEKTAVSALFRDWVEEYLRAFPSIRLELETELSSEHWIEAPIRPLKRSFFDLLDNAREALEGEPVIRLRVRALDGSLRVTILNEGKELPEVVLEKWGEPFVTTKTDGTGLGLFNALSLVQAMGGELSIERVGRRATQVEFSIPLGGEG